MALLVDGKDMIKKPAPPPAPTRVDVKVDAEAIVPAFKRELKALLDEHYDKLECLTECDEEEIRNGSEREWEFTVERDPVTALITKIRARPV